MDNFIGFYVLKFLDHYYIYGNFGNSTAFVVNYGTFSP